jgi:hypothetical protein
VGIFDRVKKDQADMAQAAQRGGVFGKMSYGAGQAEAAAVEANADAMEATGPAFEPIEGVTWDRYIDLCILMAPAGTDTAKHQEIAEANGVPAGRWPTISQSWTDRLMADTTMMQKFGTEYGRRTGVR